jgi:hypothetical protein
LENCASSTEAEFELDAMGHPVMSSTFLNHRIPSETEVILQPTREVDSARKTSPASSKVSAANKHVEFWLESNSENYTITTLILRCKII